MNETTLRIIGGLAIAWVAIYLLFGRAGEGASAFELTLTAGWIPAALIAAWAFWKANKLGKGT